jgi:hypothetical protein
MPRRPLAPGLIVLLVFFFSATFQAEAPRRTLRFAELTYGVAAQAMVRDQSGSIWFGGRTCMAALPVTADAIQPAAGGPGCHGLIGRMTSDGRVTYLSYFGGSALSTVTSLALDAGGNLIVGGWTDSADFPTTPGAFDRTCGADGRCITNKWDGNMQRFMDLPVSDGFVTRLSPRADRILYSTFIGGTDNDYIFSVAVDSRGRIHAAGSAISLDFPVTPNALQRYFSYGVDPDSNRLDDAVYVRLTADGSALEYGTYLGGYGTDWAAGVAVDPSGDAYVTGSTTSTTFPTLNAAQPQNSSWAQYPYTLADGWLARFSAAGALYSTYVGGSDSDGAAAVAVVDDDVYLAGTACSTDFPAAPASSAECRGFISELNAATGSVARTAILHGAGGSDIVAAISVDHARVVHAAGWTYGTNAFPTTADARQRTSGGGQDAFLAVVDMGAGGSGSLLYSTYLGGADHDQVEALAVDGAGGVYLGGESASATPQSHFPSVNAQPGAGSEQGAASQPYRTAFVAYVAAGQDVPPSAGSDVVLYTRDATVIGTAWHPVNDPTAAGGRRLWNPDATVPKITTAAAAPASYVEMTFDANAGVPYHLWLRMKADNDSWENDSVFVQFSDSVDEGGNSVWRIGTPDATIVSLEDCGGCGEHGWGWNDNGYARPGQLVQFAASGRHTLRIQQREDGISIDQVVLSAATWLTSAPGAPRDDTHIVGDPPPPPATDTGEIVMHVASERLAGGANWLLVNDASAAGGARLFNPDQGAPKSTSPAASGGDYFEVRFTADAGVPYHLWVRSRALDDYYGNDSVMVQFSDAVDANGAAIWRIGTNSATNVILEDCGGCGEQGWGWTDNAYGAFAAPIYFARSGPQTIRVLRREDGISIDQIVLSAGRFFNAAPGSATHDTTIVPR